MSSDSATNGTDRTDQPQDEGANEDTGTEQVDEGSEETGRQSADDEPRSIPDQLADATTNPLPITWGPRENASRDVPISIDPDERVSNMRRIGLQSGDRGGIVPNIHNVFTIMKKHTAWEDVVGYDQMSGEIIWHKRPPGMRNRHNKPWTARPVEDTDYGYALMWFQENAVMTRLEKGTLIDALNMYAKENSFHPLQDYLRGLEWDGVPRVAGFFATYFNASGPTEYLSAASRVFLISLIARAMTPGCKMDTMVVLEGNQNAGKSTALEVLASEPYFADSLPDFHSKDAADYLEGIWLVEVAELDALRRAEATSAKAFLSRRFDRLRPAYGRNKVKRPRTVVLAGTTNADTYLKDATGNRRFMPVACGEVELEALERDRDQLFAEAMSMFKNGAKWWVPKSEMETLKLFAQQANERMQTDSWEIAIANYLRGMREADYNDAVEASARGVDYKPNVASMTEISTKELLDKVLDIPLGDQKRTDTDRVCEVLTKLGWVRDGRIKARGPYRDAARFVPGPRWDADD